MILLTLPPTYFLIKPVLLAFKFKKIGRMHFK